MKGQFSLYYLDGKVENLAQGVRYEVTNPSGTVVTSGITDASGQTATFESPAEGDHQLRVPAEDALWTAPDTVKGPDESTCMELTASDAGIKLQKVRLKPFHQVRFISHADHRPIANAKYTAYALDANGKRGIARDMVTNNTITGSTDKEGKTKLIGCGSTLVFEFEVPNSTVKVSSQRLAPRLPGQIRGIDDVALKTVRATTMPNPNHTVTMNGKISLPVLISPQDEELILVGQSDYDDFEEVSGRLDKIMAAMHFARLDLSAAIESGQQSRIEAAEKALAGAQDKVKTELNNNFSKSADLKEVITLESYSKGGSQIGLRRRYLRTDRYMQLRNKRLNQAEYKLNLKFAAPVSATQVGQTVNPKTLDAAALKESIKKVTLSVKNTLKWSADPRVLDLIEVGGNKYADTVLQSETYQVDAQAQWLRLVGCAGASAELDWKEKKAQVQGNLQGKLVLCESKVTGQWACPSLKGWMIELAGEDLGAIRFLVELQLYGFAGAKVTAAGAVGITLEQGKQLARAIKNDPKQSFAKMIHPAKNMPKFDPMSPYEATPKDLNGVKFDVDAFAGVEAGITPAGKIQWLPPQESDFVSFAEVSATVAGNAGAGLSASLAVFYADGKFRVRAAARLCWGLGAKGAVEFTVDGTKVGEFVKWLHYQLLHAGFRKLLNIDRAAFRQLSQLLVLLINKGYAPGSASKIEELAGKVDLEFDELQMQLELAQQRDALVNNINRSPHWLVHAPPETKGMLLYQITRHGTANHARDLPSPGGAVDDWQLHFLPNHKKAVCTIMKTVQTAAEWDNVMQHMTSSGTKSGKTSGQNEGEVLRFLNNGVGLPELPPVLERLNRTLPWLEPVSDKKGTGNAYLDEYLGYRGKLMDKFPQGYKVASMDTSAFDMLRAHDGAKHPQFGVVNTHCRGEAFAGEPGSSVA